MQEADVRKRVKRRKEERMDSSKVIERNRFGGGSVMESHNQRKTELVFINGNLNNLRYCFEME